MSKILAITSGEPAGIGPDICLDLIHRNLPAPVVILGDMEMLEHRAKALGKSFHLPRYCAHKSQKISGLHIPTAVPVEAGKLDARNARYVIDLLDKAYSGIVSGEFSAMITAPVHKGIINDAHACNEFFSGHTEYLAQLSHTKRVVMMLSGGDLRVALATTHLPLSHVPSALSQELLREVIDITIKSLNQYWNLPHPRLLVCALNPHAGEGGHLGHEEIDIITPVIAEFARKGQIVRGPFPADTVFQPFLLRDADAVLAMYHDQGLPVLKYASFGKGVNITLGLPFIRTSVDHGTALNLAGKGIVSADSLWEAVKVAYQMAQAQRPASIKN